MPSDTPFPCTDSSEAGIEWCVYHSLKYLAASWQSWLVRLLACLLVLLEFAFQDKSLQRSIYESWEDLCPWIQKIVTASVPSLLKTQEKKAFPTRTCVCPSNPTLYSFFTVLALCLKSQIHSAHCINKIIIATPRTHSCTNMIQSSYKLQIPQEPPWKTDLWCIHTIHYLLARKNNCWHMEKCRLASKIIMLRVQNLIPKYTLYVSLLRQF